MSMSMTPPPFHNHSDNLAQKNCFLHCGLFLCRNVSLVCQLNYDPQMGCPVMNDLQYPLGAAVWRGLFFFIVFGLVINKAHFNITMFGVIFSCHGISSGFYNCCCSYLQCLPPSTRGGHHEVNCISWYPQHRGEGYQEPQGLPPVRVFIILAISDRRVFYEVEAENKHHEGRGEEHPADVPVPVHLVPNHLFYTTIKFLSTKYPTDGNGLEENTPEKGHTAGRVEIHQLKHIDSSL